MSDWTKETTAPAERKWEEFYRNRFQHDKRVRTTHGVNCTGSCSWEVFVKDGIVTWELQATDYPAPGGWPAALRAARLPAGHQLLVVPLQPDPGQVPLRPRRAGGSVARGARRTCRPGGGLAVDRERPGEARTLSSRRAARAVSGASRWDEALEIIAASVVHTVKQHGPDRVIGFSPIPAMSQVSYAAGSRFLTLLGGVAMSFYDWYCDLPPASPEIWGEQTDVHESADWYNSRFIAVMGANLNMTRTPDAHFIAEVRHAGAKLTVFSPDFSQVAKYADYWIPVHAGQDTAFWMAVNHVLLKEFYVDRQVPYFVDYLKQYTDMPFLVEIERLAGRRRQARGPGATCAPTSSPLTGTVENGDWKLLVWDKALGPAAHAAGARSASAGRSSETRASGTCRCGTALTGEDLEPELSFVEQHDEVGRG